MMPFAQQEAAPSFDHPLEMLHACHGKIMMQCSTLRNLAMHLSSKGCDQQAQQAAHAILRYFDTAGQFHHQDEEDDLFPVLLALSGSEKAQIKTLVDRLLAEHVVMFAAWGEVRAILLQIAAGINAPLPGALAEKLIDSYITHICGEEKELLPLAAHLLNPEQIMQLGKSMAERRGAKFPQATA